MRTVLTTNNSEVFCLDDPDLDAGGACHRYAVVDAESITLKDPEGLILVRLKFQHGPVHDKGVNGIQHIDLLTILEDRLRSFQLGDFASTLNEIALAGVQQAIAADRERTNRRSLSGTEGFNVPSKGVELADGSYNA